MVRRLGTSFRVFIAIRMSRALAFGAALLASTIVSVAPVQAADVPQSFTLDGRLFADAAATTPLLDSSIGFLIQILDENKLCVLYEENQLIGTLASQGYFSVQVGTVVGSIARTSGDSANSMATVFQNIGVINGKLLSNGNPCATGPTAAARRFVRITISPPAMGGAPRVLQPDLTIDSVPNAVVAERAETLQGFRGADFLKVNTGGTSTLTQTNLESLFTSPTRFTALTSVVDGTSTSYMRSNAPGGAQLPIFAGAPTTPAAGAVWYDSSDSKIKYQTAGGPITVGTGTGGGTLSSLTAGNTTNTIDSLNFAQTWDWSMATTETPLSISANTLTSGSLLSLTTSNASAASTNGLLYVANTGATSAGTGAVARIQSNSTAGSGLSVLTNGNVGIGVAAPTSALHISGRAGTAASPSGAGGLNVTGGAAYASGNGNGGGIAITGGAAAGTGTGGDITITSGAGVGSPTYTRGGNILIRPGEGQGASTTIYGGTYGGAGAPAFALYGSGSVTTGSAVLATSGSTGLAGGTGGISVSTGTVSAGFSSANAGNISITAGNGGNAASLGGSVSITAGSGGVGNNNGSNVTINPGAKGGTASDGNIVLGNLRGNVGVGTSTPASKLSVVNPAGATTPAIAATGAITSGQFLVSSGSAIDFSQGNMAVVPTANAATTSFALSNMIPGGAYTVVIHDTGARTYAFTGCTTSFLPTISPTAGNYTVFSILYFTVDSANVCAISWVSGF